MSHTTAPECEEIEPLLAAYALGEHSPALRATIESHLAVCARCQATLAAYTAIARLLPLAAPEATPAPALRERVLAAMNAAAPPGLPPSTGPLARLGGWLRPARLFVALALVALLAWNLSLQSALSNERASHQTDEQELGTLLQAPERAELRLDPGDVAPDASGSIIVDRAGTTALVSFANLPALAPGQVYQIWFVSAGQDRTSAGTFQVDPYGCATFLIHTPGPIATYSAVGITVEPAGGSPGPTTPRVIGGPLS